MKTVQLAEIAEHPREILDRARQSPLLLEEDGEALAVVLSPAAYEAIVEDRRKALERYVTTFRTEIEKGFEGPFEDLSPAGWEEIRREGRAAVEVDGLALPLGWSPSSS